MGEPSLASPGLLVTGIVSADTELFDRAEDALADALGTIVLRSPTIPFSFTDYYEAEMGPGLLRRWVGFEEPVLPDTLADIKLITNRLEFEFRDQDDNRRVNLDPGILTMHSLVLASTKDFAHRISIGQGIYAELTLLYRSGGFHTLEWTYPDYRSDACLEFLADCREFLAGNLS